MAQEANFLQGLNMILSSQQERERFRVQQSLAMMQYAQQKKMQDIQIASESLKLAKTANDEIAGKVASEFLTQTGLGAVYSGGEGEDRVDNITDAVETIHDKGWSNTDATRIATAIWSHYETKDSDALVSLASELGDILDLADVDPDALTSYQKRFYAPFTSLGMTGKGVRTTIKSAMKVRQNDFNISKEMMQFTKKDYDIQSDIGLFAEAEEGIKKAVKERVSMDVFSYPEVKTVGEELDKLNASLEEKKFAKQQVLNEISVMQEGITAGVLSGDQNDRLKGLKSTSNIYDDEILDLSNRIAKTQKKHHTTAALAAKKKILDLGFTEMAAEIDIKELSDMLEKFPYETVQDVLEGDVSSMFWKQLNPQFAKEMYGTVEDGGNRLDYNKLVELAKDIKYAEAQSKKGFFRRAFEAASGIGGTRVRGEGGVYDWETMPK